MGFTVAQSYQIDQIDHDPDQIDDDLDQIDQTDQTDHDLRTSSIS